MANYKELKGTLITSGTSDPSSPVLGQLWYNAPEFSVKVLSQNVDGPKTWAAGDSIPAGKTGGVAGGTITAAWTTGGTPNNRETYLYNGSAWSTSGQTNRSTQLNGMIGFGTSTSALITTGTNPYANITDTFNGSTWSSGTAYPTSGSYGTGTGTTSAGLGVTLYQSTPQGLTVLYNGSWTVSGAASGSYAAGAAGTQTSALKCGSANPSKVLVQSFNGSSWTTETSNAYDREMYTDTCTGSSSASNTIVCGGSQQTEFWNGTAWATEGLFNRSTNLSGGSGTQGVSNEGFVIGGATVLSDVSVLSTGAGNPATKTVFTSS